MLPYVLKYIFVYFLFYRLRLILEKEPGIYNFLRWRLKLMDWLMYLSKSKSERKRKIERGRMKQNNNNNESPILWFILQTSTTAGVRPRRSQQSGTPSGSSMQWDKNPNTSTFTASQARRQEAGLEAEWAGFKPGTPMRNVGMPNSSLILRALTLTLGVFFSVPC